MLWYSWSWKSGISWFVLHLKLMRFVLKMLKRCNLANNEGFYCILNCQETSYQRNILHVFLRRQWHKNAFPYFIFVNLWKPYPPHNPSMHELTNNLALLLSHIHIFVLFESVNNQRNYHFQCLTYILIKIRFIYYYGPMKFPNI